MLTSIALTTTILAFVNLVSTTNVSSYSTACQLIIDLTGYNSQIERCSSINTTQARLTLVSNDFCMDLEYYQLVDAACGGSDYKNTSSPAKIETYNAFNKVSKNCLTTTYYCVKASAIAIMLKLEEQYCSLVKLNVSNLNSKNCLLGGQTPCTLDKVNKVQAAACLNNKSYVNQMFSNALIRGSPDCFSQVSFCTQSSPDLEALLMQGLYCDAFKVNEATFTIEECLSSKGSCNAAEFTALKDAACGVVTNPASVTQ